MAKPSVVCDTNILISALGWHGNEHQLVRKALLGEYALFFSPQILEEFVAVAARQKLGISAEEIDLFTQALISGSTLVFPIDSPDVIKEDPADNKVLACALEAKADYLITGDSHLLRLGKFKGTKITTTKGFFDSAGNRKK